MFSSVVRRLSTISTVVSHRVSAATTSAITFDYNYPIQNTQQQQQQQQQQLQQQQVRFRSNRSRRGVYDGKDIRSGSNVSHSMRHTKRTFKPNVFLKRVYSETLDEMVRLHITTSALRTIDKCAGLDNYILTSKHIKSGEGLVLKKRLINRLNLLERIERNEKEIKGQESGIEIEGQDQRTTAAAATTTTESTK